MKSLFSARIVLGLASGLSLLAATGPVAAQTYHAADLGALLSGAYSYAYGINNAGQVVGYWNTGTNGVHAFLYSDGTMTDIGTPGGTNTYALGINAAGQVVGFSDTAAPSLPGSTRAFLYSNGAMTNLGSLGGLNSYAYGLNTNIQIVGYIDTLLGARAVVYANGNATNLGTLGGADSYAYSINASGSVVGASKISGGNLNAFLWENGVLTNLNALIPTNSGWALLEARGINDAGNIVGWGRINGEERAFLYSNGAVTDLGIVLGTTNSYALGLNNSNQVVGASTLNNNLTHAFLWQDGVLTDLNDLLPTNSGWELREARGINEHRQIAGWGIFNGQERAFLLTPPPAIGSQPQSQIAIFGQNAVFSVGAWGSPQLNYQWHFNGSPIAGATSSSLTVSNVQLSDGGDYTVTVSNVAGSVVSAPATLTVHYSLTLTATTGGAVEKNPLQASYPPDSIVTLSAAATNENYRFGGWSGDAGGAISPLVVVMDKN